jgi:hypothetical protein
VLSVKQFLVQKLITEMKHPLYTPYLALDKFWPFPKIKSAIKGRKFQYIEDIKKIDDDTENYSRTGVPKIFPTLEGSTLA